MSTPPDTLAAQQRSLLALLKDRDDARDEPADPYLERVRASAGLRMLRTIVTWWRRYDLERQVPLTSRLLEQTGRFESDLAQLARDAATPTSVDALGIHFLERLADDPDRLVAAVARTERALGLLARGDRSSHTILWDRDPAPVLRALLAGETLGDPAPGKYGVVISAELPGLIAVESHADRFPKGVPDGHY
jgi:hypothetical protein